MHLEGVATQPAASGEQPLPAKSHYLTGNDSNRWRTGVPTFGRVRFDQVYPGIDLTYYGSGQRLEFDFHLAPRARNRIRLRFDGADSLRIGRTGELIARAGELEMRQYPPVAYQELNGRRVPVKASYRIRGDRVVVVDLGPYDSSRSLVIDPVLEFSTYLGGSTDDTVERVTVDSAGNAFVIGDTDSANFPVRNSRQPRSGLSDVFIAKFSPDGALQFCTLLGGSGIEAGFAIALDSSGNILATGNTNSDNFPLMRAFQTTNRAGLFFDTKALNGWVAKLTPDGSTLVYSTYFGGTGTFEAGLGIAADGSGNAIVLGRAESANFPTRNPIQSSFGGGIDAFVAKFTPDGTLTFSTFLGGGSDDIAGGLALDPAGDIYVTGSTLSLNFPTRNPIQPERGRSFDDAFVTKINAAGTALVYSTYLGGRFTDVGRGIAVDRTGRAYILGTTASGDFPTVNPIQSALANAENGINLDLFLSILDSNGSRLTYSTYFGGAAFESARSIAVDGEESIYIAGFSNSDGFPSADAGAAAGGHDAILAKFTSAGALSWSMRFGGARDDRAFGMTLDSAGFIYVCGNSLSSDFPTVNAFQAGYGGAGTSALADGDGFLAKISQGPASSLRRLSAVNAASSTVGPAAAESIVAAYGADLAPSVEVAPGATLPDTLAGVSIRITDSAAVDRAAPLFFVSPGQVNFLVPAGTALGVARVTALRDGQPIAETTIRIEPVAPALFTANSDGRGVAAAIAIRVASDGTQSSSIIFTCPAPGACTADAIDPGPESDQVILSLFGTGIRGRSSPAAVTATLGGQPADVLGAVAQGEFAGLDQVNVRLARSLAGRGDVTLQLTVDGRAANPVMVRIGGTAPTLARTLADYFPISSGQAWNYRATFAETVDVPYQPVLEAPPGLLCTSIHCGLGRWTAGQVTFAATVAERLAGDTWRVQLTEPGRRFYFFLTGGQTELRTRTVDGGLQLELISVVETFRARRVLARLTPADLAQTQTVTVAAGQFSDVVRSALTLTGDGQYVTGTYTTEVLLAPQVGIIRAVMHDSSNRVLYTLELESQGSSGPVAEPPRISSIRPASGIRGQTISNLILDGENLGNVTAVEFAPSDGITVSNLRVTTTTVTAQLVISSGATTGTRNVSATSAAGRSNTLTFTVQAASTSLPTISSIRPTHAVIGGPPATITLRGFDLGAVTEAILSPPTGVTYTGLQAADDRVTLRISASSAAARGTRAFVLGAGSSRSNELNFAIYDPATSRVPQISNVTLPSSTRVGDLLSFTLNFNFIDNDGDLVRDLNSDTSAKARFRFTRSGTTCAFRLTPNNALDLAGRTSGAVVYRASVSDLDAGGRGDLTVSIIDAAGNESNGVTLRDVFWACPDF